MARAPFGQCLGETESELAVAATVTPETVGGQGDPLVTNGTCCVLCKIQRLDYDRGHPPGKKLHHIVAAQGRYEEGRAQQFLCRVQPRYDQQL